MSSLHDLAVNLLATALAFTFGRSYERMRTLWRFRSVRAFWKPFVTGDLKVITSIFIQQEHYIWERSGLVGVGDVMALNELRQQLQKAGVNQLPLTPSHQLTGLERRGNLVLVGGPHSNQVTAEVMQRLPLTFHFGSAETPDANIYDASSGDVMQCMVGESDQLLVDQGILIRAANPFNPERNVIILAGSFGFGTSAAAQLLAGPELLAHPIASAGLPFEATFSVEIAGGTPQRIELRAVRRLDSRVVRTGQP
ncbi:hypothetical protein ACFCXH_30390 [Streptomyces nojiriensis]|uniref:hypothetical protein n=1 Tax=Streptomyces nojiriensis TaxID=66374 RepID=UPI0035D6AD41